MRLDLQFLLHRTTIGESFLFFFSTFTFFCAAEVEILVALSVRGHTAS